MILPALCNRRLLDFSYLTEVHHMPLQGCHLPRSSLEENFMRVSLWHDLILLVVWLLSKAKLSLMITRMPSSKMELSGKPWTMFVWTCSSSGTITAETATTDGDPLDSPGAANSSIPDDCGPKEPPPTTTPSSLELYCWIVMRFKTSSEVDWNNLS